MTLGCKRGKTFRTVVVRLMVVAAMMASSHAQTVDGKGYVELGAGYKTGDFGTPIRTDLYYAAPAIGYVKPPFDFSVIMPYLFIGTRNAGQSWARSGIGDVILRAGYQVIKETGGGFSLDGSAAGKLPTADNTRGMGSGKADVGVFAGLHQRFRMFKLTLMGGFIKVGDPPLVDYNDVYLYGVGISKVFARTEAYLSLEGRRSIFPGAVNPLDLDLGFYRTISIDYAVKGSALIGLNKGGPDFGANMAFVRWF